MKISNDVLDVLSNAVTAGNTLTLTGQLDRKLYEQTNKVLEAAGGKWNRKAKAHVFEGDAADAMDQIILAGEITTKQDFGYFPTPASIVDQLIEKAEVQKGMLALEPSVGTGSIAIPLLKIGCVVDGVELQEKNAREAAQKITAAGYRAVIEVADFLSIPPELCYDRVIMNPPFARQADIHHVNHALKFLKPGGLLVSVMSSGVTFRSNRLTTEFRSMIDERGGEIMPLPEGSFKESGTGVNTVIVKIPA